MDSRHIGRNDPCPCGSGKKYKSCCLAGDRHLPPGRSISLRAGQSQLGAKLASVRVGFSAARSAPPPPQWNEVVFDAPLANGGRLHAVLLYSDAGLRLSCLKAGELLTLDLPDIQFRGPASVIQVQPTALTADVEAHVLRVVRFRDEDDLGCILYGEWERPDEFMERWTSRRREVVLRLEQPGGGWCDIQLLRTVEWITEVGGQVGGRIFLDLREVGVRGWADVLDIKPCRRVEPGPGDLVTGTFRHSQGCVGEMVLESEAKPIGVTPGHLFWSVDRQAWVPVSRLRRGETLSTMKGITRVVSYELSDRVEPVYNLEVAGSHCYRVGESGVLVHNQSGPGSTPSAPKAGMDYGCENPAGKGRLDPCESGLLNTKLGKCPTDYQAHHLIACSVRHYASLRRAAELGFDINGALNGWCLPNLVSDAQATGLPLHRGRHLSGTGTDPNYFACVQSLLVALDADYLSGQVNDCNLCAKVASVIRKIRRALATHKIWLQQSDPNRGTTWQCPPYR